MAFDFSAFDSGPAPTPTNPRELFDALPQRAERYEFLRDPQGQVLQAWYKRRTAKDLVIKLNTGGGKTVVGLLICQSSQNEGVGPVLYLAPDPYLARQAMEQAQGLGLEVTNDPKSARFASGEAICVLSLHRFVNGKSIFGLQGDGRPVTEVGTIVVDDAHAALATVREKFTLTLSRTKYSEPFAALLELFADDLRQQSASQYLDLTTQDSSAVAQVPFWAWTRHIDTVTETLHALRYEDDLEWSWPLIKEVLPVCRAVFTADRLEIQPPYPPIGKIASFSRARRRVHLTATLADDSVLVTDFAADPTTVGTAITPANAGYLGDRLILAPQEISPAIRESEVREMAADLAQRVNVVVIVPSYRRAAAWADYAEITAAESEGIGDAVARLRAGHVGLVVLVNQYDGIDLPRTACEVLVLDGLPQAYGGLTRREAIVLGDSDEMINRQLQRIEQGMGRGVRSANDHCVVLLLSPHLSQLIATPRYRARFGPATLAQIDLSRKVAATLVGQPLEKIEGVIRQVLDRDPAWITASRGALAPVTYPVSTISPVAAPARLAFDQAALGQYAAAVGHMSKAVAAAADLAERGFLQEQLAAYQHFIDEPKAQQTLVKALEYNPALLRPIAGVKATRIKVTDPQAVMAAAYLARTYANRNDLLVGIDVLVDELIYHPKRVPAFERALERLGRLLGFEAQRPERATGNGPDVLWAVGDLKYLVLEAKSGATVDKIWRSDVAQLAHSMNWFQQTYDQSCSATPVILHRVNLLEHNAVAPPGTRVVTTATMAQLSEAVRKATLALADADSWGDATAVAEQYEAHRLLAQGLTERFSVKPRAS
ncbi:DEAD/DEAH box helicase family protein [Streptomyces sp. So13.3]|uniref:DEAD/DEAH box helicase n=1 Tax=Streptomyces sp. So13.3 TaxID=2136173 RepID=UPI00110601C0|nr:DEAD/DEAH box helicase [Streptomyces sp. So13.3]QNA72005.1 DEAD/DEAH box helicase family protein [Streptomyces sp. So13.3]